MRLRAHRPKYSPVKKCFDEKLQTRMMLTFNGQKIHFSGTR
jgi:hypothetical protein